MDHRIQELPGRTVVELIGTIDDNIAKVLATIRQTAKSKDVVFDCSKITRINSVGIAKWMAALKDYVDIRYRYSNCSEQFIDAAVMIPQFPGDGWIESVCLHYPCDDCQTEERVVFKTDADLIPRVEEPRKCRSCGASIEAIADITVCFETLAERRCFEPKS